MTLKNIIFLFLGLVFFSACEDVIEVETDPADAQLVVDAWLNDFSEPQTIRLTESQAYFDNTPTRGVTGAMVTVSSSNNETFSFVDNGDGNYTWTPAANENIGVVGTDYQLTIDWNGTTFTSAATLNGAPPVDSITFEFRDDEIGGTDGIYAEFFSRDLEGIGDAYWIKTFKNGNFLNKPSELNIAFDAGFAPGSAVDGLIFIPPIREFINPDVDDDENGDTPAPWIEGDLTRVEIHSINLAAYDFLTIVQEQTTNGNNGIFALPLANAATNIISDNEAEKPLGIFCISQITSLERLVE